jgi:GR25 family glycosyltransferase involved in LPS biosynthesis
MEKDPFDFFDKIFCINLDERTDRWEKSKKEFNRIGILEKVERFSAIKEDDGRLGIIKSNLEIIKYAKKENLNNVLIFEDDVHFIMDNVKTPLTISLSQIGDLKWSLFYLGANTHNKLIKLKPNLILLKNSYAVHAMAYNKCIYDKMIMKYDKMKKIVNYKDILDVFLAEEIQSKRTCLMTNPMIATQRNDYSNIENKNVNYEFIEERFKNNIK